MNNLATAYFGKILTYLKCFQVCLLFFSPSIFTQFRRISWYFPIPLWKVNHFDTNPAIRKAFLLSLTNISYFYTSITLIVRLNCKIQCSRSFTLYILMALMVRNKFQDDQYLLQTVAIILTKWLFIAYCVFPVLYLAHLNALKLKVKRP